MNKFFIRSNYCDSHTLGTSELEEEDSVSGFDILCRIRRSSEKMDESVQFRAGQASFL